MNRATGQRNLKKGDLIGGYISGGTSVGGTSFSMAPVSVASWTAGTTIEGESGYYYTLNHGKGRSVVGLHIFDEHKGIELNALVKEKVDNNNTKVFLSWQPAANRITLYYY
jgi:hypothetical protein